MNTYVVIAISPRGAQLEFKGVVKVVLNFEGEYSVEGPEKSFIGIIPMGWAFRIYSPGYNT